MSQREGEAVFPRLGKDEAEALGGEVLKLVHDQTERAAGGWLGWPRCGYWMAGVELASAVVVASAEVVVVELVDWVLAVAASTMTVRVA